MVDIAQAKQIRDQRGETATRQQRRAANPQKSVWVEASAGTGKTKVLSDRVLRLLLNGISPAKILCLTYTKAAAVEMSSRIAGRLSQWAVAEDADLEKELVKLLGELPPDYKATLELKARARQLFARLLDTPGGMKIQTIHSFCQEILKRFPLEAKISPYFEVMDDRAAKEALQEIKLALLKKIELEPESQAAKALAFLTQKVSETDFVKILNSIAEDRNKIIRLLVRYQSLDDLLADIAARLGVALDDDETKVKEAFWADWPRVEMLDLAEALSLGTKVDLQRSDVLYKVARGEFNRDEWATYRGVFMTTKNEPKSATKAVLAVRSDVPEIVKREAERCLAFEAKLKAVRLMASTAAVLRLAEELIAGYMKYKSLHSKMDYEDLIVLARNLLENPEVAQWVLYKLDGGIDSVLIDEAQDTSPDQWAIVKALTEEFFAGEGADDLLRTVFVVGDRKQSIYSFQGADPEEFENMRRYFKSADENFEEVHLDVSFRSTSAVLESVNTVFRDEELKDGVVLPEQDITHLPFRFGEAGKVEIWPLIEPQEGENQDAWRPPVERVVADSTSSRLAQGIAQNIKSLVERGDILISKGRPLCYGDFMVLVQRRNSFVEELVRACKNVGVNIAGVDKIKLLEQIAIQDLVAVGRFLLLPTDDLTLAEILKSPLWGLDDDDLLELCYGRGAATLWTRLGDNPKYAKVYAELQSLLNMADFVRPFELYAYILNKLGGRQKFVKRMGPEVEDGIDEFVNLTLSFEQEHIPSLQGFVEWVMQDDVEIKREQEQSNTDAVRIMTVHGSKGLQAPVVILPDTVRVPQSKREGGILWSDVMLYPLRADDYDPNCEAINQDKKRKALQEYRRLLYVALTRAEDRLYICGYKGKNAVKEESWYEGCVRNLQKISTEQEDGVFDFACEQVLAVEPGKTKPKAEVKPEKWDWLYQTAPEEDALAKPYTPSKPDEDEEEPAMLSPIAVGDENRYRRGQVIHTLLQFLPDVRSVNKTRVMQEFLDANAPELKDYQKLRIVEEVGLLLQDKRFAKVFGPNSKAEVPVMGMVEGKIISGQIDRLVVDDDEVLIVDFKTNRPAADTLAEVPDVYLKQLRAYRQLVEAVYPQKKVQTLILWTDTAHLMPVE